jgi:HD-GYP domain-containing protein (c-di-GMP phosphodiesterase class II)
MAFRTKSFGVRAYLFTGIAGAAGLGLIAGVSGSVWFAVPALGAAFVSAWVLSRWIAHPLDGLIAVAGEAARAGCISEGFPAGSPIQEFNRLAETLNCAARSVHHSQADLDCSNLQFIETMAQVLEARDPYTAGHSMRVGAYAYAIARAMDVPAMEAENIRIAAQLHDIGKIGIPDAVLQKPGRLSAEEFGLVKLHPQIGRRILEKMGKFQDFLPVVELHHENHDGTGYPYKLAGDRIPLAARIVHVADAFDAMVTHRHYRSALALPEAIIELRVNSGTQFDPAITPVMLRLIETGLIVEGTADEMLLPASEDVIAAQQNFHRAAVEVLAQ